MARLKPELILNLLWMSVQALLSFKYLLGQDCFRWGLVHLNLKSLCFCFQYQYKDVNDHFFVKFYQGFAHFLWKVRYL